MKPWSVCWTGIVNWSKASAYSGKSLTGSLVSRRVENRPSNATIKQAAIMITAPAHVCQPGYSEKKIEPNRPLQIRAVYSNGAKRWAGARA
jgi:hypothetical protein